MAAAIDESSPALTPRRLGNASDELFRVVDLATRYVDTAAIGAPGAATTRRRHPFSSEHSTVSITGLYSSTTSVLVAGYKDEGVASAAANDVDFAVNGGGVRMIARYRHRPAALPLIRGRVKNLVSGENQRWSEEREVWVFGNSRQLWWLGR